MELSSNRGMKKIWLISCVVAILSMFAAGMLIPLYFGTNDDSYVIQALSGNGGVAAKPTPYIPFVNYVLCWIFVRLYSAFPWVPWWVIFHFAALFITFSVVGCIILAALLNTKLHERPFICGLILFSLDFGFGAFFIGRLQFTSTASLLMATAILLSCLHSQGYTHRVCSSALAGIISFIMGIIGFALRSQSGFLGLFFWGLAIIALLSRGSGNLKNRLIEVRDACVPFLCALIAVAFLIAVDDLAYSTSPLNSSLEMDSALAEYTGYPHVSYVQDPSRYQAVGWDEELSKLADQWFLLDDRITTENLTELNEQNTAAMDELVEHPWSTALSRLHYISQPIPMCYLALLLGVAVTAFAFSTNRWERITAWVICGSVVLLLGYLLLQGRLLERAAYAVTIPATAALLSIVLRNVHAVKEKGQSVLAPTIAFVIGVALLTPLFYGAAAIGRLAFGLGVLYCLAILVWSAFMYRKGFSKKWMTGIAAALAILLILSPGVVTLKKLGVGSWEAKHQEELLANTEAFFNYVNEHPDTLYIYAGCPMTMQYVWQDAWPTNQTGWGGWRWPYEWFDEAMCAAGFNGRPTSEDFLDGDAMFVSSSKSTCDLLLRYMRNTFGEDVQMVQIDEIAGGMKVYQFVRSGEQ